MKQRSVLMLGLVGLLVVSFQNCTPANFATGTTAVHESLLDNHSDSGHPYDGKIFVSSDVCADGTMVATRIVLQNETSGSLVRENCQDVNPPRALTSADFQLVTGDTGKIIYGGKTLVVETPQSPVIPLASWYLQVQGTLKTNSSAFYDVDLFDTTSATIASLKSAGHRVICNVSAGTAENWHSDYSSFQAADLGQKVTGTSGEKWVDTRSANVRQIMLARLDLAAQKGCEIIDFDAFDGYSNATGFPLTQATQEDYGRFLAFAAHDRRLQIVLRNAPETVANLVDYYDLAITEECFAGNFCDAFAPFAAAGKAILSVEYTAVSSTQCAQASAKSMSLIYLNPALDGSRAETCP